jgi:hypothetical protein
MYDKFTPFLKIPKRTFTFTPKRYEIWFGGKLINSGVSALPIYFTVIQEEKLDVFRVSIFESSLHKEIAHQFILDEFITSNDRLQLVTIPSETNPKCLGLEAMKMIIGATRDEKNFESNEPYCGNLFLQQDAIVKITFSFSNPEKLIEFYS